MSSKTRESTEKKKKGVKFITVPYKWYYIQKGATSPGHVRILSKLLFFQSPALPPLCDLFLFQVCVEI